MGIQDNIGFLGHFNDSYVDSVGIGDAPTLVGDPVFDATNKMLGSHAADIDGDDTVHWGNKSQFKAIGAWSIGKWIRPISVTGTLIYAGMGAIGSGWALFGNGTDLSFSADIGAWTLTWSSKMSINTFQNIVITKSDGGASSVYKMYHNANLNPSSETRGEHSDPIQNFGLGLLSGFSPFPGQADELVIWNDELSASDVSDFYNGGAGIELGDGVSSGRRRRMVA